MIAGFAGVLIEFVVWLLLLAVLIATIVHCVKRVRPVWRAVLIVIGLVILPFFGLAVYWLVYASYLDEAGPLCDRFHRSPAACAGAGPDRPHRWRARQPSRGPPAATRGLPVNSWTRGGRSSADGVSGCWMSPMASFRAQSAA
jgi:hypothetical protein